MSEGKGATDAEFLAQSIRHALGKIAREVSVWPLERDGDARIVEAVTDAGEALEALEQTLGRMLHV